MDSSMGDRPLALDLLLDRAERLFARKEVRTASADGVSSASYAEVADTARRIGGTLDLLGIGSDARVGSMCWSTREHLDLYFGVPCSGRILHTLNPRFSEDQIHFVISEARNEALFVHESVLPALSRLWERLPSVRHVVVIDDSGRAELPSVPTGMEAHRYTELLAAAAAPRFRCTDERAAAVLCHTGGTTGDPKGVMYSHRSLVLHAMAATSAGTFGITEQDVVMPIVPLFHANAVGFAHAAVGTGATLVLPGSDLSGPAIAELLEKEAVSVTCGVPTIWASVLPELAARDLCNLRLIVSGASAVPQSLSEAYRSAIGLPLTQIWGMTETSPLGTIVSTASDMQAATEEEQADLRASVGLPVLGVEARIADDAGSEVEWDGETSGELQVRGPWVAARYFGGRAEESFTDDGWLRTGDIVTGDQRGYLRVVDRAKDVIKSGGEWISSIALENHLMSHPEIAEAAVVAAPDPKWGERPVAFVVAVTEPPPSDEELSSFLADRVPRWWIPDRYCFTDAIPRTSVGKFAKAALRDRVDE